MKILELRFKNLNSIYGEWVIDLTDPEYVGSGIFALTGPTGAGKSTLLDAVCLALYGATPRLDKITKSSNEIMSRQTGECYAEVVFESQAGRFRCHWEHRRARKNADGALQIPEHQIADALSGKVIENKKSRVVGVVEEKTGMDFDRFTRSILLAQGGFDTFLRADEEKKSKILEQITGTGIYSEISQRVHERRRDEDNKLNLLQSEVSGIVILEPDKEKEIALDLAAKQKQEVGDTAKRDETKKAIDWLTAIDTLKKEISDLSDEAVKLQDAIEVFKPERERLALALKAASLDGTYATLTAVRKQQKDDQAALETESEKLPTLETSLKIQADALKKAEEQTLKVKNELKTAAPLLQNARSLDQTLSEQKKAVSVGEEAYKNDAKKNESDKKLKQKKEETLKATQKKLNEVETYFTDHARDEWLVSGLAGIEEQLSSLLLKGKEIHKTEADQGIAQKALSKAVQALENYKKQCDARKQDVDDAVKKTAHEKETLKKLLGDRLLREYRTEKETLLREKAFREKIAELEDHRAKLEDGKPCPLCGSQDHPFAKGNIPVPDEIEKQIVALSERIEKAENQEAVIKSCEEAEQKAQKNLAQSEKLESEAVHNQKTAEKNLSDLTTRLTDARSHFEQLKQAVTAKLQPLGISDISDVSLLLDSLKKRLASWQDQVKKKAAIETQISDLSRELARLDAVIETQGHALAEKQNSLDSLRKDYSQGLIRRQELYGDKNPDHEEKRLNTAINQSEKAEKKAESLFHEMKQAVTTTKTRVDSLTKQIDERGKELKNLESDFISDLQKVGFEGEPQLSDARLTPDERDRLSLKAKSLDEAQTDLKARQKDRETRLSTESAKKITDKTREDLLPEFKDQEEKLKELLDTIAGLKHTLSQNVAAKERIKDKQKIIDAQKNECRRWEKLHALIGSADGKKYRNFAQGLTFELMVSHANRQLEKMTDRYLLIRDNDHPLELNVIDNYQAGEIRSTRNLSGGESFIVSLTLALGLSKMASRKVRVDSLFLDEGFGTLDEDALDTALETLSGLQQDGKLIGIISHVSALKERIGTQITVTPVSGGRSFVEGPGCKRIGS